MCGRTACTLSKENIQKACGVFNPTAKTFETLEWHDVDNCGKEYKPSYNMCPTDITPVVVKQGQKRVLKPMVWGMIPPWHMGSYNNHKLSTNNCRIETILESKMFKGPLTRGQRCVVVCDGFYEWQTTKGKGQRQPYFVYSPQPEGLRIDEPKSWSLEWTEQSGWSGPRLLYLAAIFDTWKSPEGETVFSYSIVTMESNDLFGWLHHRVPAILDTDKAISDWLDSDSKEQTPSSLLSQLKPDSSIVWHPVDPAVNNSRNKDVGLNRAIDPKERKPSKSASMMEAWLGRGTSNKRKSDGDGAPEEKKKKTN